jgi:ribosomal 50S subunit-associated protein YjgA (DUF615 family)
MQRVSLLGCRILNLTISDSWVGKLAKHYDPEHHDDAHLVQSKGQCHRCVDEVDEYANALAALTWKAYLTVHQQLQFDDDLLMALMDTRIQRCATI